MTNAERNQLWDEFLAEFTVEHVREMQLAEYTNANKSDAFIYWLEKRLEDLGSIWGGSAFKFGIYRRQDLAENPPAGGRRFGAEYAWMEKYGATEQEAFKTVRTRIVQVIDAIRAGDLERVDEVEFSPAVKWKIAFLYQNRNDPLLFPIYKRDCLFYHYHLIDPTARKAEVRYSVMYPSLLEKHRPQYGDVFALAEQLWKEWKQATKHETRSWAVPLTYAFTDPADARAFCQKGEIVAEDIPDALAQMLSAADISVGDRLALLVDAQVLALGELTSVEPDELAWTQKQVSLNPELVPVPTSEVHKLEASEQTEIWGEAEEAAGAEEGPSYWKVAAETDGSLWPLWRDGGYVSVGWDQLGDISSIDEVEFEKRRQEAAKDDPDGYSSKRKVRQVWRFRHIRRGDRIVANQGTARVFGIGTVIGDYYFQPGEDYPHRLPVQWDDIGERRVNFPRWLQALLPINPVDFEKIISTPIKEAGEEAKHEVVLQQPAKLTEPQNIILFGPPGTGKTYSTVRRALELVVGKDTVQDLSDDVLIRMFRDKQSQGQIEFVTFHQSYGYEEFVEGIRPVLEETDTGEVRYEVHDGVFKRIALRAAAEGLRQDEGELSFDVLWSQLIKDLAANEDRLVKSTSDKTYVMRLSSRENIRVLPCEVDEQGVVSKIADSGQIASKDNVRLIWDHRRELGVKPEEITSDKTTKLFAKERGGTGGHHYTAIWVAYRELFGLLQSLAGRRQDAAVSITRVQDVLDKRATFSFSADSRPYVLVIDEINRGNISKILGELITLIEADKRLGMPNELRLPLAYSPAHRFGVPPNLHIIGTMNTADRSIALMDVALRRRFTFEELLPNRRIIENALEKRGVKSALIDLVGDIFEAMNSRIRFLYDRDHQIGHAYFLGVTNLDDLKAVFRDRVLPLLQEYFYGAWEKISVVLGCPYGDDGSPRRSDPVVENGAYRAPILQASVFGEEETLGFDHDRYESRVDYRLDTGFDAALGEELAPYFLGILNLTREDYESRRSALTAAVLAQE